MNFRVGEITTNGGRGDCFGGRPSPHLVKPTSVRSSIRETLQIKGLSLVLVFSFGGAANPHEGKTLIVASMHSTSSVLCHMRILSVRDGPQRRPLTDRCREVDLIHRHFMIPWLIAE
jgi:hypothetical protein